jgi:hypothetical protein
VAVDRLDGGRRTVPTAAWPTPSPRPRRRSRRRWSISNRSAS